VKGSRLRLWMRTGRTQKEWSEARALGKEGCCVVVRDPTAVWEKEKKSGGEVCAGVGKLEGEAARLIGGLVKSCVDCV